MPAGLVVPVSGPYRATYSPAGGAAEDMGIMNDDGYELSVTIAAQEVNESDAYGMTLVEGISRGMNWKMRIRGLEWNRNGLLDALASEVGQSGNSGTLTPFLTGIGNRMTATAGSIILSATLANPPTTPQSLTALNAIISPNSTSTWNMTSKLRELPIEFSLVPYVSGQRAIPFSTT